MKFYHTLKKITIILIIILTVLLCFWALIFLIKETLNYTIFSSMTEGLFFALMGAMILLVIGLAIINVTANLNLISESITKDQISDFKINYLSVFLKAGGIIIGVVLITWLTMHLVNRRNTYMTAEKIMEELDSIKGDQEKLVDQLKIFIDNETNLTEIRSLIEIIDANTFALNYIEVIFPKMVNENLIYLRINRWNSTIYEEEYYSPLSDTLYITENTEEKEFLEKLYYNQEVEDYYFVDRPYISVYSPVYDNEGNLIFVFCSSYNDIYGSYRKLESASYY